MIDHSKRHSLKALSLLGITVLGGCCSVSPKIEFNDNRRQQIGSTSLHFTPPDSNHNFVKVIDAHSHFFNGSDLQAGGYLSGPLANEWSNLEEYQAIYRLVRYLGNIIQTIANIIAPSARDEWRFLDQLSDNRGFTTEAVLLTYLDNQIENEFRQASQWFYDEVKNTDFPKYYEEALTSSGFSEFSGPIQFDENVLYQALTSDFNELENTNAFRNQQFKFDPRIIGSIMSFVGRMLCRRFTNIRSYQKNFTEGAADLKVVAATDVLVDFDYWLGDCDSAFSRMQDQIYLHERINQTTNGYTIPIVAFNPWKAAIDKQTYLDILEDAFRNRGFKGAKIYPTIGYYPHGKLGTASEYRTRKKLPKEKALKNAFNEFYRLCHDLNIVVMAHGNYSMGERESFKDMAGPAAWRTVFKEINTNQRVNIGHFGGEHANWMQDFTTLMRDAPNLYADLGYRNKLIESDNAEQFINWVRTNIAPNHKAIDRILYGTDWFMLDMYPDWRTYMTDLYTSLKIAGASPGELDKIFYQNARELFNL